MNNKNVNDIEVEFEEISNNQITIADFLDQVYTNEACLAETAEEQLEIIKRNLNHKN